MQFLFYHLIFVWVELMSELFNVLRLYKINTVFKFPGVKMLLNKTIIELIIINPRIFNRVLNCTSSRLCRNVPYWIWWLTACYNTWIQFFESVYVITWVIWVTIGLILLLVLWFDYQIYFYLFIWCNLFRLIWFILNHSLWFLIWNVVIC